MLILSLAIFASFNNERVKIIASPEKLTDDGSLLWSVKVLVDDSDISTVGRITG
jgi:hypothetical protein